MNNFNRIIYIIMLGVICLSNVATPAAYAMQIKPIHFDFPLGSPTDTEALIKAPQFAVPDKGSVLGASTTLFTVGNQKLDLGDNNNTSAFKRTPIKVEQLTKKVYETTEDVAINVLNPDNDTFSTSVTDAQGNPINVPITESNSGPTTTVDLAPSNQIKPGLYKVTISDIDNKPVEQDFTWGVLALNTDKSMYHQGDKADIAMAVLNNNGDMVCDAQVNLEIFAPDGQTVTLSTQNGTILISPQCQKHDYSLEPDYAANYTFLEKGLYQFQLTATTTGGTHSITDAIQVTDNIPFDVQRISATRIYPPNTYPMLFNITANRDFNGTVTETVPDSFIITPATQSAAQPYNDMQTVYLNSNDPAAAMSQEIASNSGGLVMPFHGDYPITQGFGAQLTDPTLQAFYIHYGLAGHDGIDFGVPMNTPLYAVDSGDIIWSGPGDYGTMVTIKHSWGQTYYGHMTTTSVSVGQHVQKGQLIGYSGMSGEATGPHLHFGMKPNNPDMNNGYYGKIDGLPFLPYGHQEESISALGPLIAPDQLAAAIPALASTVLGASSASNSGEFITPTPTTDSGSSTPSVLPSVTPGVSPTSSAVTPIEKPTNTPTPAVSTASPTQSEPTVAVSDTPTPTSAPSITGPTAAKPANTNFSVLGNEIRINEQIANSALTDKVKILTWNVKLKKGETITLGYAYQTPKVSPQFYLLGPAKFYSGGNERVVFQEDRQWQIAADDVGVDWYTNTTGNKWNGYSWQYRRKLVIDHTKVVASTTTSNPTIDFMDDGGDANGAIIKSQGGFWNQTGGTPAIDTSFGHTGSESIKFTSGSSGALADAQTTSGAGVMADAGRRVSEYVYFNNMPTGTLRLMCDATGSLTNEFCVNMSSSGVLGIDNGAGTPVQIATGNNTAMVASTWYRVSFAYVITSTTNFSVKVYLNGTLVLYYTQTSAGSTLNTSGGSELNVGWDSSSVGNSLVLHMDDFYIDSGTDLSDVGDVRITNKRPFANGSSNGFTTLNGTPSGYGSNHAPYVNEAPPTSPTTASVAVTTTGVQTEEYNVEGISAGSVDLTGKTILGHQGWVYAQDNGTAGTVTSHIILDGISTTISVVGTVNMFIKDVTSSSYPAGTGSDIGMDASDTVSTIFTLDNAGEDIAYIASTTTPSTLFMNDGGDADQDGTWWVGAGTAGETIDSTVHHTGPDALKLNPGVSGAQVTSGTGYFNSATGRFSEYVYFSALPGGVTVDLFQIYSSRNTSGTPLVQLKSNKLTCADGTTTGSTTFSATTWTRVSVGYNINDTGGTVSYNIYLNGNLEVTCSNQTLNATSNDSFIIATPASFTFTFDIDDIYLDNGSDMSDPGDIRVTAKLPIAKGASNDTYTHNGSPSGSTACSDSSTNCQYVNERPRDTSAFLSTTGTSTRENFAIQSASQGDVDLTGDTIVGDMAWIDALSTTGCATGKITNNGTDTTITLNTTAIAIFSAAATSTYPSGNQAVGIQSCSASPGTTEFMEGGMLVAYTTGSSSSSTSLTNFPVFVSFTGDASLNAYAQGSGNDILFTDSTGRTLLNYEVESYSAGTLAAWVQIPSLSSTTDTVIYMYYGNPSASAQVSASTVWDSNYRVVAHLHACNATDSTSNAFTFTCNSSPTTATGELDGGLTFNGSTQSLTGSASVDDTVTNKLTVSAWFKPSTVAAGNAAILRNDASSGSTLNSKGFMLERIAANLSGAIWNGATRTVTGTTTLTTGTWYYGTLIYDGSTLTLYLNGSTEGTPLSTSGNITLSASTLTAAASNATNFFGGTLDELRVSDTNRSSGWIKTEYNNQSSPGTFIPTVGSQETDIYAPNLSQLMRHGEFFNTQGQIQPFVF